MLAWVAARNFRQTVEQTRASALDLARLQAARLDRILGEAARSPGTARPHARERRVEESGGTPALPHADRRPESVDLRQLPGVRAAHVCPGARVLRALLLLEGRTRRIHRHRHARLQSLPLGMVCEAQGHAPRPVDGALLRRGRRQHADDHALGAVSQTGQRGTRRGFSRHRHDRHLARPADPRSPGRAGGGDRLRVSGESGGAIPRVSRHREDHEGNDPGRQRGARGGDDVGCRGLPPHERTLADRAMPGSRTCRCRTAASRSRSFTRTPRS